MNTSKKVRIGALICALLSLGFVPTVLRENNSKEVHAEGEHFYSNADFSEFSEDSSGMTFMYYAENPGYAAIATVQGGSCPQNVEFPDRLNYKDGYYIDTVGICVGPNPTVRFGDSNLKSVNLTNVRYINREAFWDDSSLKNVTLTDSLESIGEFAFRGTSIETISIAKDNAPTPAPNPGPTPDPDTVCWAHWVLISVFIVGAIGFAVLVSYFKKEFIALITVGVSLVLSIVFACFGHCTICVVFTIINILTFVAGIVYLLLTTYKEETSNVIDKVAYWFKSVFAKIKKVFCKKNSVKNAKVKPVAPKEETTDEVKEEPRKVTVPESIDEEVKEEELTEEQQESTLKESMKVAASSGVKGVGQKLIIAKYLKEKYGEEVEVNTRPSTTPPGRGQTEGLPLADTHYTLKNGNRKCFVYVYDIGGNALLIVKAPKSYGESLKKNHNLVTKSAFPKTRDAASWYSIPIDGTWTDVGVCKVLDDVKTLVDDPNAKVTKEKATVSLKESIAMATAQGTKGESKKAIIAQYLKDKYGNKVEVNNRPSTTPPGRGQTVGLPLADTHYTLANKQRKCFVYVYDLEGATLLLVKVPDAYGESLMKNHKLVSKSDFPKTRDGASWYSVTIDESWNDAGICKLLDDAKALTENPNGSFEEEVNIGLTLKQSMEVAASSGVKGGAEKGACAEYLRQKYGKEVEVNNRPSTTPPGRGQTEGLPLADTHYTLKGGKRKCFVYIYDIKGSTLFLIKAPKEYGTALKRKHKLVSKSAFPKTRDGASWYSVTIDDTWTQDEINNMLDEVKTLNE